jgi:hypothetical protein
MMNTAEIIYAQVKAMPEPVAKEILSYVEFMSRKAEISLKGLPDGSVAPTQWPQIVLDYTGDPDFPAFEDGREELAPPVEDPLA